ncbi:MAG: tRNA (adenosine(37)-N6)-dimethylallyltransferase MiaA [Elusimicrobia bacterium]|nr:tRNA (adenosine(37)-N6)-dimethylallyltransferase MiaA [Elusimicrobiota bacterium]
MIVLVGPTGSGKTDVALAVAKKISAEVISADSRQVYRDLNAGTAKPTGNWSPRPQGPRYVVQGVVHHLLDHVSPTDAYTAGRFNREAMAVLEDLSRRRVPAVVVGGTGLYVRSLVRGLAPLPEGDLGLRKKFAERADREGREALHQDLVRVDPLAAQAIPPNNIQRVIRALEVHSLTGRPLSELQKEGTLPAPLDFIWFGLRWDPSLYQNRIKQRCQNMVGGILMETNVLLAKGVPATAPAFQSLGYREAILHCAGRLTREEFENEFLKQTRFYAKRQLTWFRGEPAIQWIDILPPFSLPEIAGNVLSHL